MSYKLIDWFFFTFSYLAKPPMTAGSTMPLSSIERGLMGRVQSAWYWLIMVRIFSLVDSMVSIAFSNGDKVVWEENPSITKNRRKEEIKIWWKKGPMKWGRRVFRLACGRCRFKKCCKKEKKQIESTVVRWGTCCTGGNKSQQMQLKHGGKMPPHRLTCFMSVASNQRRIPGSLYTVVKVVRSIHID